MPRRTDIKSILIIGAGPIVIGQACEFDYSGTQACRVLRDEGIRVSLINSNPATIMTDPEFADATYVEPINAEFVEKVLADQQNRGYPVDADTLPANVRVTHRSLFDGTLQGIALVDRPAFSFQGHPEASPGPHDVKPLFDRFIQLMIRRLQNQLRARRAPPPPPNRPTDG